MVITVGKLVKSDGGSPSELENRIGAALAELSVTSIEMKGQLDELYSVGAQDYAFGENKCIVIYVPVPQLRDFQKLHVKLVRELEKKFSGKHVLIVAKRRILEKQMRGKHRKPLKQKRPRSRTLTAVHDAILSDMVFPAEVVGRRTRYKLDGNLLFKVHLDKLQETEVEEKIDTIACVYKHLTGKEVIFEFPEPLL